MPSTSAAMSDARSGSTSTTRADAPTGRERVRRLATDPLTRAEHDEALAVEAQQPRIVGDGGVVGTGHDAATVRVDVDVAPLELRDDLGAEQLDASA